MSIDVFIQLANAAETEQLSTQLLSLQEAQPDARVTSKQSHSFN